MAAMFFDQSGSFIIKICLFIPRSHTPNLVLIESIFQKFYNCTGNLPTKACWAQPMGGAINATHAYLKDHQTEFHQIWYACSRRVLKVPYHKKHVFSALYIYKLVLPEPANSQKEENKRVLHGLCSPPTGNTALRQAVQILLLSLLNERSHYHRPTSSARW